MISFFADLALNPSKTIRTLLLFMALPAALGACLPGPGGRRADFSGERALQLVERQVVLGPRNPGSEGHEEVQELILDQLSAAGWETARQPFSHGGVDLANLIGRRSGSEGEWIVLGAHYDTRPVADEERSTNPGPVPGANDGASGVAVLLELAHSLPPGSLGCDVWWVFFDAEDSGRLDGWDWILGSRHFVAELDSQPDAAVIVDMVGDRSLQLPRERNSTPALVDEIWATAAGLGHGAFQDRPGHSMLDDHTPFLQAGVPAVDIIDFDYPYWHTEADTMDKVSAQSLAAVGETVRAWLIERCQ